MFLITFVYFLIIFSYLYLSIFFQGVMMSDIENINKIFEKVRFITADVLKTDEESITMESNFREDLA